MKRWDPQQLARAAGARLLSASARPQDGPERATIDSREAAPGVLFVGLPGEHTHGGEFARAAMEAGAWGVLTDEQHAEQLAADGSSGSAAGQAGPAAILAAEDPLLALQTLARAWRRALGAQVIAITGSTGKTSTKDLLAGVLAPHRLTVASRANFNTEIGLPLQILAAPAGTEVLVLEMGMRGPGQIAQLAHIAEPDVGVIVSIGPVHLELLGSIEAVAAAKAELLAALAPGAVAVLPAGEPLLEPHLRADLRTLRFGEGGQVALLSHSDGEVVIDLAGEVVRFEVELPEAHLRHNLLAACAAAHAVGVHPGGRLEVEISPGRGETIELPGAITLIDSSYNANPMSMRAALDQLAATAARKAAAAGREGTARRPVRKLAVLGDMLELGAASAAYHAQVGSYANRVAEVLITVGPLAGGMGAAFHGDHRHCGDAEQAAALVPTLLRERDVVLVKGSLGVGLRRVCDALTAAAPA